MRDVKTQNIDSGFWKEPFQKAYSPMRLKRQQIGTAKPTADSPLSSLMYSELSLIVLFQDIFKRSEKQHLFSDKFRIKIENIPKI